MKALIQRVISGKVTIDGKIIGEIGKGYVILLGVKKGDSEKEADLMASKTVNLRVMGDSNDKMNLSIKDVNGEIPRCFPIHSLRRHYSGSQAIFYKSCQTRNCQ